MGIDQSDGIEDAGGGGESLSTSGVSCSICLDPITDNGDRSWAKLQCGHEFHLDCIGSAFNVKGAMQCPNCRKIEKGQWLFATSHQSFTDIGFEDWPHDEDPYDMAAYSQMSFGVHWCPITPFPGLTSSFEDVDFPSTAYHDLLGQHAVFAEHTVVPSSAHPCPYAAYYGPIHSSSSRSVGSVSDGFNFSSHWGGPSGSNEIPTYSFAAGNPHYNNWEHHSLPFSASDGRVVSHDQPSVPPVTQRSSRSNFDLPRSASIIHPSIVSHSSAPSLMSLPYPGSVARARVRAQALQAYFQQPSTSPPMHAPVMTSTRGPNAPRGMPVVGPLLSSSDQSAGFCVFPTGPSGQNYPEVENPITSRYQRWEIDCPSNYLLNPLERDSSWGGFHPPTNGSSSFRLGHGSSQSRS